ncbi:MAG: alkaline phosphatase family protein [Planctomycetota bacterium]|nr:alkaline phosphatase family protein [Planctomycetota bacterium]
MPRLLVIQAAGLDYAPPVDGLAFAQIHSVLPALTCSVQASFRTASPPGRHGMVANGLYHRSLARAMFWEQSAGLVHGQRIWDPFRDRGKTVAMLFWQQSMGEAVDMLLTPAPIHKHHGGMIEDCLSRPAGLYESLCQAVGRPFKLRHYWGPLASPKAGDWIAQATAAVLARPDAPDLCLTYLPTLDYDFQRFGPAHPRSAPAKLALTRQLQLLLAAARAAGYETLIFGDYAIAPVAGAPVFPNRALRAAGLLDCRDVRGMLYPDLPSARAFAMVDHEIAHVYVRRAADVPAAAQCLKALDGVGALLASPDEKAAAGLDHPNTGELVLLAQPGRWFAYPWWADKRNRPDYATHVDIHNKPGFDPCELFFAPLPIGTCQQPERIGGTHGLAGAGRQVTWAATTDLSGEKHPTNLIELARAVRGWLERQ